MRSPLRNRWFRVHLVVFCVVGVALVLVDLLQSESTNPMLWGLHWAPIALAPWAAILRFHGFSSIWGAAVDDVDDVRAGTWV